MVLEKDTDEHLKMLMISVGDYLVVNYPIWNVIDVIRE